MTKAPYPDWIQKELARVDEVRKRSTHREAQKPRLAIAAYYDAVKKHIVIALDNGAEFSFPPQLAMGLATASGDDLAVIEVSPLGTGLHWPRLDVDLTVDGLLAGVFGSRSWMRDHAVRAGSISTPAKAAAARENGSKGGRPRKNPVPA